MQSGITTTDLHLYRHAFSPRGVARAGEVWRLFQQAAVAASCDRGWPPQRYLDVGRAFVIHEMRAVHHREICYGERAKARSWIREFRRKVISIREVRLEDSRGPIAEATQTWVHVNADLKPVRATPEMLASFAAVETDEPEVCLPDVARAHEGPPFVHAFPCWHTWLDPLGHANHPAYVDWCDEALSQAMSRAGLDPAVLVPVAEQVRWKDGVVGGDSVVITSQLIGWTEDNAAVFSHEIRAQDRTVATATTVRSATTGREVLGALG